MKNKRISVLTISFGLLLAVAIVFSHTCQSGFINDSKQSVKSEQKEQKKDSSKKDHSYISVNSISLPTTVHVQLNLAIYCLFEILGEEEREEPTSTDVSQHPQKFFQTLFRVIISPNAP